MELARAKSPYYRELYSDISDDIDEVADLPVTDKTRLMARYDDWATDREVTMEGARAIVDDPRRTGEYLLGRYSVRSTSGTTGVPGIFVIDNYALAVDRALALRTVSAWLGIGGLAKVVARGGRMAFVVEGNGHDAASVAAARQSKGPLGRRLNAVVRVQAPLDEKVAQLNRFRPAALFSNPSEARLLANEQEAGRLRIAPLLITLSGEGLVESEYDRIARAFTAKVVNWYAANECSFMTYSCREGWLHVNSDWVVLEPVDEEYRPVAPGTESHTILVSNLANRVQPILRYDIGDRAVQRPDPCPCGVPLPAIKVQGRASEMIHIPNAQGDLVGIPPGVFTDIGHVAGIDVFQIEQVAPAGLQLRFRTTIGAGADEVWRSAQATATRILAEHKLENVTFERSEKPPYFAPGGKLPRVLPLKE